MFSKQRTEYLKGNSMGIKHTQQNKQEVLPSVRFYMLTFFGMLACLLASVGAAYFFPHLPLCVLCFWFSLPPYSLSCLWHVSCNSSTKTPFTPLSLSLLFFLLLCLHSFVFLNYNIEMRCFSKKASITCKKSTGLCAEHQTSQSLLRSKISDTCNESNKS